MSDPDDVEVLEDVVILGRAAPEELSDGRITCCTGAWSEHRGFIRLYPVDPQADLFNRWDKVNVEVTRNPNDSRHESWKLARRDQDSCVEKIGEYSRNRRGRLLTELEDDCVRDINDAGRSLGIIKPETKPELEFRPWDDDDTEQTRLFQDVEEWRPDTREEFDHEIRVEFTCSGCRTAQGYHNKTLLEWGTYVGKARNDVEVEEELEQYYDLHDDEYEHWVFVGNQAHRRTSFIAINLLWMQNPDLDQTFLQEPEFRKVAPDFESER